MDGREAASGFSMDGREAPSSGPSLRALNDVAREKLALVLAHVLGRLSSSLDQVFSDAEKQQVREMLAFSDAQVDAVVRAVQRVYCDAATFGQVDRNLLRAAGVADDVARAVDKVWRKKGSAVAAPGAADLPRQVLQSTEWQLDLEMGQSQARGQTIPTAVFQLQLAGPGAKEATDTLEVEMAHDELRALFLQLNDVQAQLDAVAPDRSC